MNYIERYEKWINSDKVDDKTKEELLSIKNNDEEIKERFGGSLFYYIYHYN